MGYLKKFLANASSETIENSEDAIAFLATLDHLAKKSPVVAAGIIGELKKQRNSLKLIASENYSSLTTQLSMGNLLTDKYAEGHPFHRFYAGCENVDSIESKAVEVLKELFGAEHAYVQPHSGADANIVAFWATLIKKFEAPELVKLGKKSVMGLTDTEYESIRVKFGQQKMMGMALDAGGHLTHGSRVNVSSKMFQTVSFGVNTSSGLIDYKNIEEIAMKEKPTILMAGYSAYPRLMDFSILKEIADKCGATLIADMAHFSGLVAGKALTGNFDPIPFADIVTSTTHKTMRGPRGGMILCKKEFEEVINKGCPNVLGGPLPHVMAAKLVAFEEASKPEFCTWASKVIDNSRALASSLMSNGAKLTTDGTDNHLMVMDVKTSFGITGRQAENVMAECGITVNRNTVPNDENGAWYTSGVRIGTPAQTTRGLGEKEMTIIGDLIYTLLKNTKPAVDPKTGKNSLAKSNTDETVLENTKDAVKEVLSSYPLYPEICIDEKLSKTT